MDKTMLREKKQRKFPLFSLLLILYACLFLILLAFGMQTLSDYLHAYELSLPYNTTDAYMQGLTAEHICSNISSTLDRIDPAVQTTEEATALIAETLTEPITFFKRIKECTDDKLVYTLRCGAQNIGYFEMQPGEEISMGFAPWVVTKEVFDFTYLLQEGFTVTVPHDAVVTVGEKVLSSEQVIKSDIPYELLQDFAEDYQLPYKVTYQVGLHIGELSPVVTKANGEPLDPNSEETVQLDNCSAEEKTALDHITGEFITDYIHFTSQTNKDTTGNLSRLRQHIVSGSTLDKRMRNAVDGLKWVTDRNVSICSITVSHCVSIGNDRYFCDISYVVDTRDITGKIREESDISVIFAQTEGGLKAEAMISK